MLATTPDETGLPPVISHRYDNEKGDASAMQLVLALKPEWEESKQHIHFKRFTDGITNTLLKAENRLPNLSQHQINQEAILLRAYGHGTHILIDRERECLSHSICALRGLAPPLLARFDNGLMYKFIEGDVTSPADMRRPQVSKGIARHLAEWHARLPVASITQNSYDEHRLFTPDKPTPNLWTVLHKWIAGLPSDNGHQIQQKASLAGELPWLYKQLGAIKGIGEGGDASGFVFSHCDLLSGNIIMHPTHTNGDSSSDASPATPTSSQASVNGSSNSSSSPPEVAVSFIDYEYATPAPAAFDIANHFAEWGGFECEFEVLPSVRQRRDFITTYVKAYHSFQEPCPAVSEDVLRDETEELMRQVDCFRGVPGFYWGVWALIQAQISQIDFNYADYAEVRLGEYWAWKRTVQEVGSELHRSKQEIHAEQVREKRWWQEQ